MVKRKLDFLPKSMKRWKEKKSSRAHLNQRRPRSSAKSQKRALMTRQRNNLANLSRS